MSQLFYSLAIIMLLIHEFDAYRCKEWQIFPGLSGLPEEKGKRTFLLAHIPLLALLILGYSIDVLYPIFFKIVNVFIILHVVLHILFIPHPKNQFKDWITWSILVSSGLLSTIALSIN